MAIALTELDQDLWFPHPEQALDEPEGLLAMGGDLSQNRLRLAYRHGIFPWYEDDQPLLWWSPPDRAVVFPDRFKPSRSLARLRGGLWLAEWRNERVRERVNNG